MLLIDVFFYIIILLFSQEIPGLTDRVVPRRLGPKRASRLRKLFNLSKDDDVRRFVVRRDVVNKKDETKTKSKAPKIQRLITPQALQRKRHIRALRNRAQAKAKLEAAQYRHMLAERAKEAKARKAEEAQRRRSSRKSSAEN
jgi:small subunit ribosomal protein S6e